MSSKTRIAVCGSSLHMAGLAASLQAVPNVTVLRVAADAAALAQTIDELAPAVVAFDLGEMPGDLAFTLLRNRPEIILIGVDPSSDRLLMLSGRQAQPVSGADLVRLITRSRPICRDRASAPDPEEGSHSP